MASNEPTKPAPPVNFTETPEFKEAVARAVADAAAQVAARMPAAAPGMFDAEALALAIAGISNQGVGKVRPVPPEVLRQREIAAQKMREAIAKYRAAGVLPHYKLRNKVYLDEVLVEPLYMGPDKVARNTIIGWPDVPSEAMLPADEAAQEIHALFLESIGTTPVVAQQREFHVTAGGLVVNGAPPARRTPQSAAGGLKIVNDRDGGYVETNVLGTVAAPARQTAVA